MSLTSRSNHLIAAVFFVLILSMRPLLGVDPATAGINKDMVNNSGQPANNIEILLAGTYTNVNHYDGYPANHFSLFTESPATGGNTLLTWSNPNNDVQPGQIAHIGFSVPGTSAPILSIYWTHNGKVIGCVSQLSPGTHSLGSAGSQVTYANNCLACKSVPRYVGALTIEWHAQEVPLAELNPKVSENPKLSGPDVTTDFLEFPVQGRPRNDSLKH